MNDRSVRSLASLQNTGSTSRILNLLRVFKDHGETDEHRRRPMFQNAVLNRSLILKHRLRANERELFDNHRTSATKIILPIDRNDLRSGGRYAFVGQRGYDQMMTGMLGPTGAECAVDRKTLEVLDDLPSFDPFLLREQLRRNGFDPAPCYFNISQGDLRRMFAFVQVEVRELVNISLGGVAGANATASLVQKLLGENAALELQPLRHTLKLEETEYEEGLFCWRGFLYYKWGLQENLKAAPVVAEQVCGIRTRGPADADTKAYLGDARERLARGILDACHQIEATLRVYDDAYAQLTREGNPQAFRDFLLNAPVMFVELGERLGALNHIISFWKYRFAGLKPQTLQPLELADLLMDFDDSLAAWPSGPAPVQAARPPVADMVAYL